MAAISKARHCRITGDLQAFLSKLLPEDDTQKSLQSQVLQLERLYKKYTIRLSQLHELITEYESMQRRITIELRKQQIRQAKQKNYA